MQQGRNPARAPCKLQLRNRSSEARRGSSLGRARAAAKSAMLARLLIFGTFAQCAHTRSKLDGRPVCLEALEVCNGCRAWRTQNVPRAENFSKNVIKCHHLVRRLPFARMLAKGGRLFQNAAQSPAATAATKLTELTIPSFGDGLAIPERQRPAPSGGGSNVGFVGIVSLVFSFRRGGGRNTTGFTS